MKTVIGLFDDRSEAQQAVKELKSHGFSGSQVNVISDASASDSMLNDTQIPQQDMRFYMEGVRQGGTLVVIRTDDHRAQDAADLLSNYNIVDVDSRLDQFRQTSSSGQTDMGLSHLDTDGTVIPVVEEDIRVGKRQVQRGGVRVHTHVTERPIEEQVTLREEHVNVERRPVDRPISDADMSTMRDQTFELTETAEEAVVSKQARVVEEVVINKQATEHTETIRDTVRRTDVDVDQLGAGQTRSGGMIDESSRAVGSSRYADFDNDFRTYYGSNLTNSGYTYDEYSPVFRYGYDVANDREYHGRDWGTIEPDIRRRWEERNPNTWEQFKDSVRYAWERARGRR